MPISAVRLVTNAPALAYHLTMLGQRVAFGELTIEEGAQALQGLIGRLAVK